MKKYLYDLCYKEYKDVTNGVYCKKGFLIATDFNIIIKIKEEYQKELEGKIITKSGDEIEGTYPNIEKVMGKFDEMTDISINKQKVIESVKRSKHSKVFCKVGKQYFKAAILLKFLSICERENMQIREDNNNSYIMGKNKEGSEALLLPAPKFEYRLEYATESIEKAIEADV